MLDAGKTETLLEVNNIEVIYNHVILVLKGVSLTVPKGGITALLGGNGAGKTTTLKAISNLLHSERGEVTKGSIQYRGEAVHQLSPEDLVKKGVIQVMEGRHCFEHLTIEENLLTGAYTRRDGGSKVADDLEMVYNYFPRLKTRRKSQAGYTSGGEQQMVAIGRAIMSAPSILLLDEPSLGLSPLLSKELFGRLKIIKQAGLGILLVEQNAKGSLAISDRGYVLENGRITLEDVAEALQQNPAVQQAYLGASKSRKAVKTSAGAPAAKAVDLPRPVDTGPNPTDIAAAAMERFSRDAPAASLPQITPQAQGIPTAAAAVASSSQPTPRAAPTAAAMTGPAPSVSPPTLPPPASPVPAPQAPSLRSGETGVAATQQTVGTGTGLSSIADLVKRAEARLQQDRRPSHRPGLHTRDQSTAGYGAGSGIGRPVAEPTRGPTAQSASYVVPEFHLKTSSRGSPTAAQGTTPSTDRLRLMLEEIEQAAARARGFSSSQQEDV